MKRWVMKPSSLAGMASAAGILLLYVLCTSYPHWSLRQQQNFQVYEANYSLQAFDRLEKCLDAVDLIEHFRMEGYLGVAKENIQYQLNTTSSFFPKEYRNDLANHCWKMDSNLSLNGQTFSGKIGTVQFHIDTGELQSFVLDILKALNNGNFQYTFSWACLPEVFVLGFPKCGTTFLYEKLQSHSLVADSVCKSPLWWSYINKNVDQTTALFSLYLANYHQLLQNRVVHTGKIAVDGSGVAIFTQPAFRDQSYEVNFCLFPSLIPTLLPKSKFITVMRNPVDAVYSFFWYSCTRYGESILPETPLKGIDVFHQRVMDNIRSFKSCSDRFPLAQCILKIRSYWYDYNRHNTSPKRDSGFSQCGWVRLDLYIYYVHILKWLSVVPHERLLFLTTEELFSNRVWKFLDMPIPTTEFNQVVNQQTQVKYHTDAHLTMRNDTRKLLLDFYRPFNQRLSDLLGDKKFIDWNGDT